MVTGREKAYQLFDEMTVQIGLIWHFVYISTISIMRD